MDSAATVTTAVMVVRGVTGLTTVLVAVAVAVTVDPRLPRTVL